MADKFLTREGLSALIKIIKQEIEQLKKIINNILVPTKTSDLINDSEFISDKNYVHTDNNYTASDKYKLDNIQFGAEVNVLSDWNVVDTNKDSYIKNKPTKVSQFDNDAGYLTQHQSLTSYATGVEYDSDNHLIYLLHNLDRISNPIDASDFIKDGMVTNVEVAVPSSGTNAGVRCLIITFNTDSGHTPIEIPLSLIAILPLVVTLTQYLGNLFTPDKTFAEATAAYADGRKVLFSFAEEGTTLLVDVHWSLSMSGMGMLSAMAYLPDVDGDIVATFVWNSASPYVIRTQSTLQPKLTFDDTPTSDSNNPVKSGGVYDAFNTYCPIIEDTRSSAVANITGIAPFSTLQDGQRIVLHFAYRSVDSSTLTLTLSGGDTTATIPIYKQSYNNVSQLSSNGVRENTFYTLIYHATANRWWIVGCIDTNTTYATMSQAEVNAGTQAGNRVLSPKLLRDNFYIKSEVNNLCPIIEDTRSSAVAAITGVAPFASLVDGQRIVLNIKYSIPNNATLALTLSSGVTTSSYQLLQSNIGGVNNSWGNFVYAGSYLEFVYNENANTWTLIGTRDSNTTYAAMTQQRLDEGTSTGAYTISPQLLRNNFYLKQEVNNLCPIIEDTRSSAVAAITGIAPFDTLVDGQEILFHFAYSSYGTSSLTLTLSDNTTTAAIPMYVAIRANGSAPLTSHLVQAGAYIPFKYIQSSNRWVSVGVVDTNDSYVALSTAELTTGTSTTSRTISAKVLRDNFYTETEVDTILTDYINTATYDSTTHKIYLKNDDTVLSEIDASDFIKDGMVNTVTIGNGTGANASVSCLIVSFNTDSDKENIEIPISNIFNADNYYTKSNVDTELAKCVTLATNLNITGEKIFVGAKRIKFKLSAANDKLGFTLYNNTNKELSYLEYNSGDLCLGSYYQLPNSQVKSRVGFKMSDVSSGVNAVYRILTPHAADAKTPFGLTNTIKDFYFPLGISDGTNLVLTGSNGLLDISQMFNDYYTKTDIDNAGYLTTIPELTDSDFNEICV